GVVVEDQVLERLRARRGSVIGAHGLDDPAGTVIQQRRVLAGDRFVDPDAGRADREQSGGPDLGDGRYPLTGGPVLEDLAQMAGVPLELRDPVGACTE